MLRKRLFTAWSICLLVFTSYCATVILKNGQTLKGEILSSDSNFIVLNSNQSKVNVLKSMIDKIDTSASDKSQQNEPGVSNKAVSNNTSGDCEFIIKLQNGTVFKGPRISENDKKYVLSVNGSPVNIFKTVISSVDSCSKNTFLQTENTVNRTETVAKKTDTIPTVSEIPQNNQKTECVSDQSTIVKVSILNDESVEETKNVETKNPVSSIQTAPVQTAPVQTAPVQTAPVQTAPVQTAPVQTAPVQTARVQTAPVQTAPVQTAPVQNTPVQTTPVQTTPVQTTPVQTTPVQTTPVSAEKQNIVPVAAVQKLNETSQGTKDDKKVTRKEEKTVAATINKLPSGKIQIALKNGTSFTGKIVEENDRYITFDSDGTKINIFKKMIDNVNGVAYVQVLQATAAEGSLSQRPAFLKGSAKSAADEISVVKDLRQTLPRVVVPEDVSLTGLIDSLHSVNWKQRSNAARMLGAMGQWGVAANKDLVLLLSDTAQSALTIPLWFDSLNADQILPPAFEAARALANFGDNGFSQLRDIALRSNPILRRRAVFGLTMSGSGQARLVLANALKDNDPSVRAAAVGGLYTDDMIQLLINCLKDESSDVRANAAQMLGLLHAPDAVKPLMESLTDKISVVRLRAAEALGQIGDIQALTPLLGILNDVNIGVREKVIFALGQIKDTVSVMALIEALKDSNPQIRISAVHALSCIRDPRSIPALYALLKDKNAEIRKIAAESIKLHTDIQSLISGLDDSNFIVRENVAYVLWLMTGKDYGLDKDKWVAWFQSEGKEKM